MLFVFDIPTPFMKIALAHVSQLHIDKSAYDEISRAEYSAFSDLIGKPKRLLEIGCGLGRMSVYVKNVAELNDTRFILADGNTFPAKINSKMFGFSRNKRIYNDLSMTEKFCIMNNLTNIECFNVEVDSFDKLDKVDFIMSFLSAGYHYPLEDIMPNILKIATPDCKMVFGVREGLYPISMFENMFNHVETRPIQYEHHTSDREQLLFLSNPKGNI